MYSIFNFERKAWKIKNEISVVPEDNINHDMNFLIPILLIRGKCINTCNPSNCGEWRK
jgi:hypothetical protein